MSDLYIQGDLQGLIEPNGGGWTESVDRANKIYLTPGFRLIAAALIASHPRAGEYLEQCPAIVSMLSRGHTHHRADNYALLAKQFGWRVADGPRLKDLMRKFELPFPMRKIVGKALSANRYWALRMIATCDPRVIASSIHDKGWYQAAWLRGCERYAARLQQIQILPRADVPNARAEWFVFAYSRHVASIPRVKDLRQEDHHHHIIRIADMIVSQEVRRGETPFDEKWTFAQALAAAERWHDLVNAAKIETGFQQSHGFGIDYEWSVSPWPGEPMTVSGHVFTPLNTGRRISNQAGVMHNCLRSYMARLIHANRYCAWSVARETTGEIVATLGMVRIAKNAKKPVPPRNHWRIDQIEGRRHSRKASDEVHAACKMFFRTAF